MVGLLLAPELAQAQNAPRAADAGTTPAGHVPDSLRVYLMTMGPGPAVYEWFGHNAIVIQSSRLNRPERFSDIRARE